MLCNRGLANAVTPMIRVKFRGRLFAMANERCTGRRNPSETLNICSNESFWWKEKKWCKKRLGRKKNPVYLLDVYNL